MNRYSRSIALGRFYRSACRNHFAEVAVAARTPACCRSIPRAETSQSLSERMFYRASLPIVVLAFRDNQDAAVPIPAREVFEAVGPAQDDRFTIVSFKGEEFLVFDSDLKQCEKLVHHSQAGAI